MTRRQIIFQRSINPLMQSFAVLLQGARHTFWLIFLRCGLRSRLLL